MRGRRSSASISRLLEGNDEARPYSPHTGRSVNMRESPAALLNFASRRTGKGRQQFWWLVFFGFIWFLVTALGLGLGLKYRCATGVGVASPSAPFNFSSYYGIPQYLDAISIDRLINTTELELKTGFQGSAEGPTVQEYVFNITQALAAPDGVQKPMMLVNGQSPGPLIEARAGDTVRVHVHNQLSNGERTTIHWHGISQVRSTWMDGVASVSQCGIPPGRNFTYEFVVDGQRGTFWWHAHLGLQYTDGVYGPIVIHDPEEMVPETDEGRIMFVGDLYHTYGSVLLKSYLNTTSRWVPFESGVEPLADNILLNGQHTYDCSVASTTYPGTAEVGGEGEDAAAAAASAAPKCTSTGGQLYRTQVKAGQRLRLRLINSSSFLSYWVSVDNHTLTIVELDGVEVEPIRGQRGLYLNVGQRVSVVLTADQPPGTYHIRATLPRSCFLPYAPYTSAGLESVGYAARGLLTYDGADPDAEPVGISGNVTNPYGVENNGARGDVWEGCDDMPFDVPKPMRRMDAVEVGDGNYQYIEYMFRQAQDVNRIFINKTAYAPLENNATLWKLLDQDFDDPDLANSYNSWNFGLNQQVLLIPEADKGAQIVVNSRDAMEHPWHLHGHTFQIVGWGKGLYGASPNGTTWNLANPQRRDTVTVPAQSHVVLRFRADNPGLWALHCHVAWHMEGGMFVSLAERPHDLVRLMAEMDPETWRRSQELCEDQ